MDAGCIRDGFARAFPGALIMARQGYVLNAETFEWMKRLPCTTICMWLFPAEVVKKRTDSHGFYFDVSVMKPGLFLFDM